MPTRVSYPDEVTTLLLSLRFNHEEFCDGHKAHRKTLAFAVSVGSGALLERRVALGSARTAAFWPSGRPPAGFRRLRGHAEFRQKRRNDAVDPDRCQAAVIV